MTHSKHSQFVIIGIAGGVGAGKSTVAQMLGDLGCVVIDSDAAAKDALQRADVIATLRAWWTDAILTPTGQVDRRAVASIVFRNPAERTRLEALIHPLIAQDRARTIEAAVRAGLPGAVIDAPLLYEAGVDRECDVVLFVDSPQDHRLDRVRKARGWTEEDLRLREIAQLPLDVKRDRADYHVVNSGDPEVLREQVTRVFKEITAHRCIPTDPPGP